jgi:hypothetical protein
MLEPFVGGVAGNEGLRLAIGGLDSAGRETQVI